VHQRGGASARGAVSDRIEVAIVSQKSGLTVRQHEREGIQVPVEFFVSPEHGAQVHLSPESSAVGQHTLRGTAVDISSGGMGLEFRQFIPRMCGGTVRVFVPDPISVGADGSPLFEAVFEHQVKVRRVYLIGREPLYAMGVAFIDPDPDIDHRITTLLERIKSGARAVTPHAGRGGA
jgi:c-di-GMP-binding flagellar brake protein YcgR